MSLQWWRRRESNPEAMRGFCGIGDVIAETAAFYVASSRGIPSQSSLWSEVAAQGGHTGGAQHVGELPGVFKFEIGETDGLRGYEGSKPSSDGALSAILL